MKYDYTGKTLFVGIDVHKKSYSVATVLDGEVVKRDSLKARPSKLIDYLTKFFSGAKIYSAYEAGFSGFGLHRELIDNGIENIVIHAASVEISSRDRVKTDKRDAVKIALQLFSGRLKCVYIPTPEREDLRELTRLRDKLVKERTRTANAIKAKGHYYGLIDPDDSARVSEKWLQGLLSDFSSEKQLFSYTGLTPSEYSSGEHRRQGHISRQGKSQLRRILVQSAWVAIRHDKNLEEIYLRIAKRAGGKRAILGIARRLIGRIRSCFRNGGFYDRNGSPLTLV